MIEIVSYQKFNGGRTVLDVYYDFNVELHAQIDALYNDLLLVR